MMDYRELRKLKAQLIEKENKTEDELHLLMELQSLSKIIDTIGFSLQMSGNVRKVSKLIQLWIVLFQKINKSCM